MTIIKIRYMAGHCKGQVAEKSFLQPAFFRGAMDAHGGREKNNPYQREIFRQAYLKGFLGVKYGRYVVEKEEP